MSQFDSYLWQTPRINPSSEEYHSLASAVSSREPDSETVVATDEATGYRYCEMQVGEATVQFVTDPNGALSQVVGYA